MDVLRNKKVLYLAPELPALSATVVYNEILRFKELGGDILLASVHQPMAEVDKQTQLKLGTVFIVYNRLLMLSLINFIKATVTVSFNFIKEMVLSNTLIAFLVPSVKHNNAGMETVAIGMLVLSGGVSNIKELVIKHQTKLLIEPGNTITLAEIGPPN